MHLFSLLVFNPLYNALVFLYDVLWTDLGVAIVVLTILIKLALLHFSRRQISSQKEMQEIQPKLKEVQKRYKDDKERLAKETMALYKEHKINPAAGCLPLIVQMIVFITLYRVLIHLLVDDASVVNQDILYAFVPHIEKVHAMSLGFIDLVHPNYVLAAITAAAQYYQIKMMQSHTATKNEHAEKKDKKDNAAPDFATVMSKQMLIIIPVMTLVIGVTFPAGLAVYWLTSTVFMIVQQWFIMKKAAV